MIYLFKVISNLIVIIMNRLKKGDMITSSADCVKQRASETSNAPYIL